MPIVNTFMPFSRESSRQSDKWLQDLDDLGLDHDQTIAVRDAIITLGQTTTTSAADWFTLLDRYADSIDGCWDMVASSDGDIDILYPALLVARINKKPGE